MRRAEFFSARGDRCVPAAPGWVFPGSPQLLPALLPQASEGERWAAAVTSPSPPGQAASCRCWNGSGSRLCGARPGVRAIAARLGPGAIHGQPLAAAEHASACQQTLRRRLGACSCAAVCSSPAVGSAAGRRRTACQGPRKSWSWSGAGVYQAHYRAVSPAQPSS